MKAQFIGCTLAVTPESDEEREQLKYYGSGHGLWECFGFEDDDQTLDVQSLCPLGLSDVEIANHIRYMLELDVLEIPEAEVSDVTIHAAFLRDSAIMDQVRKIFSCDEGVD